MATDAAETTDDGILQSDQSNARRCPRPCQRAKRERGLAEDHQRDQIFQLKFGETIWHLR